MAVIQRTFAFASGAEGLVDQALLTSITFAFEGADGSPAGCVKFTCATKNLTNVVEAAATSGLTWESYGVPAGATVNTVRVVSWQRKLATNGKLSAHSLVVKVGGLSLVSETLPTAAGAWLAGAGIAAAQSVAGPSSGAADLRLEYTLTMLGGGGTAALDQRVDQIVVEVDYTEAAPAVLLERTASDVAPATDTVTRSLVAARSVADAAGATDAVARAATISRSATDAVPLPVDTPSRAVTIARSVAEAVPAVLESVARTISVHLYRTAADVAGVVDSVRRAVTVARSASDSAPAADSVAREPLALQRSATDTVPRPTESLARVLTVGRQVAETLPLVLESVAQQVAGAAVHLMRTASDVAGVSDTVSRSIAVARSAADALSPVTDAAARTLRVLRRADDAVSTSDSVVAVGDVSGPTVPLMPGTTAAGISLDPQIRADVTVEGRSERAE